jgi:iron complex outermembrane receptor protein
MLTARRLFLLSTVAVLSFAAANAPAQQTREQAVAAMRKVEAKEMDATYTTPAPMAQKLVNEALAKHPEILLIAIHATPPGHQNVIVASNFGRIGKIGDEDDMRCIHTGKANLEIAPTGDHFEDELVLQDAKGKTIGALGVVFNYKKGDDKLAYQKIATAARDEMKKQLPNEAALFAPAN